MASVLRTGLLVLAAATAGRLLLAAHHALLADEALYWVWSSRPAWGYYDQPPLLAWVLAAARLTLGESPLALRILPILAMAAAPLALYRFAGDRDLWLVWWSALPPLFFLGLFATPDAWLLPLWAGALAAALHGGRGWAVAGLLTGLAFLAKYSAAGILPLLIAAADPEERRSPWPWVGVGLAVLLAVPNLAWNAQHAWISFDFQLREGILHPHAPGALGPLLVLGQQLAVATPIAGVAGLLWLLQRPADRTRRMAWATSAPILAFFTIAAIGGPPDAHWPAPAWVGIGLGLSHATGRLHRVAWLGAWTALLLTTAVAVHSVWPLLPLPVDPRDRLTEGPLLGDAVAAWVLPEGAAAGERLDEALPIFTERYQEAALVHYHTGLPARVFPGCGRANQYDLWPQTDLPAEAWMLRPATSGPDLCTDAAYPFKEGPFSLRPVDGRGRAVGHWQLFRIRRDR